MTPMQEVTRILSAIEQGDPYAAAQLLPLVYDDHPGDMPGAGGGTSARCCLTAS
jgi:hypothetical protein